MIKGFLKIPFYQQENHNGTAFPLNCSSGAQVQHGEYKTHWKIVEESMNVPIWESGMTRSRPSDNSTSNEYARRQVRWHLLFSSSIYTTQWVGR